MTPVTTVPEYMTKEEAARHLRVSTRQIERLVKLGHLPAYDLPTGAVRYMAADVHDLPRRRGEDS